MLLRSTSLFALLTVAGPLLGQEAFVLDPVIVSSGLDQVASETPQSVSVVDQDDLDREQPTTIGDALTDLPGVKAFGTDLVLGERFNIRGFGQDLDGGDENRLIITVDGANKFYQQYRLGALFTEPELYKRVEVLRGPASSTLYGSGALGGVITLETKDASDFLVGDDRFALRQKLEFTSNGEGGLTSTILAARPTDSLELLGAFTYRFNDDFEDADGIEIPGSAFDAPSGLVKARLTFGQDDAFAVSGSYQLWTTSEDNAQYEQTTLNNPAFGEVDRTVTDQTATLEFEYAPPDSPLVDLQVLLSYSDTRVEQENATNPSNIPSTLFEDSEYAYETFQARIENRSALAFGDTDVFLTYGLQASRQNRVGEAADTGFISFQAGGTDTKIAGYVQAEVVFPFGLTLIPGLRYEYSELKPDGLNTSFTESATNTALSPKLAALYEVTEDINVFGSVSYTERLPVLDEVFDGASGNLNLDPEQAFNWEVGASYSTNSIFSEGDALVAKATYFRNEVDNLIERDGTSNPFLNVAEASIQGFELEAAYDSEFVFGSLAYTLIRGEGRDNATDPITDLTSIPADEISFTVGGRVPQYDFEAGLRGVLAFEQENVPDVFNGVGFDPGEPAPGYGVFDVFASWKPDEGVLAGTEVRFSVENVLDKQYQVYLTDNTARGRTFRVSLARTF
ncbi:MAG: TonB-dependent receptor [Pseudomonadota bacterium]